MNKEFVPFELALKLKQLGFNEPCISHYTAYGKFSNDYSAPRKYNSEFELGSYISAPIFSQAFRWFRDKYFIHGEPKYDGGLTKETAWYDYTIISNIDWDNSKIKDNQYKTYEEAELACLEKLIEILEKK
jgi:hypothetical protein